MIFISKINSRRKACRISEEKLLDSFDLLLEGNAETWFRHVRSQITSWEDLCGRLKNEFLPVNFEKLVKQLIKNCKQMENEGIGTYLARIGEFMDYLPTPYSEEKRFRKIRNNLLKRYKEKIVLEDIVSENNLIQLINKIDLNSSSTEVTFSDMQLLTPNQSEYSSSVNMCPSTSSATSISFSNNNDNHHRSREQSSRQRTKSANSSCSSGKSSYNDKRSHDSNRNRNRSSSRDSRYSENSVNHKNYHPKRSNTNYHNSKNYNRNNSQGGQKISRRISKQCFKCDSYNHLANDCPSRIIRCYKCRKVGFTLKTCPNCSKAKNY